MRRRAFSLGTASLPRKLTRSARAGAFTWATTLAIAIIGAGACDYDSAPLFPGDAGPVQGGGPSASSGQLGDGPFLAPRVIPGNAPEHCNDGQKTADESDVDCGGGECATCAPTRTCGSGSDCFSKICTGGVCTQAALDDGVQNSVESGVDCGGEAYAPRCPAGQGCRRNVDCESGICTGDVCVAASITDGIKNGSESDVDCGGLNGAVPRCGLGKLCNQGTDCESTACSPTVPAFCTTPEGANGNKDPGETDRDCGGADLSVARCGTTKICAAGSDCLSGVCSAALLCQNATGTDGLQNGDESDVDCGKATTGAPKCPLGKKCRTREDCKTGGCGADHLCTDTPSCGQRAGGLTCGPTESALPGDGGVSGDAGAAGQESCCAEAALPSGAKLDKYVITAGRMRAMVEALQSDVHGFIAAAPPPGWNPAWTDQLPVIRADVDFQLGPWNYGEGCHLRYGGARTYDTDTIFTYGNGQTDRSALPRAVLDEKALNCVPQALAAALCAFDAKRLATPAVIDEARMLGGAWPWGADAPTAERMNHDFGTGPTYTFPAGATELSAHVSAPGRVPDGNGSAGHADVVGLLLPWIQSDTPDQRIMSLYSWSVDEGDGKPVNYAFETSYVIGARCMR